MKNCEEIELPSTISSDHEQRATSAGLPAQRGGASRSLERRGASGAKVDPPLAQRRRQPQLDARGRARSRRSSRKPAIACGPQRRHAEHVQSAELIVCSSSAPSAAPTTLPLPPKIATPPTTTAAITWSSSPVRGGGVDRAVPGRPEHAGEAGERAADHERGEHAPGDRDAGRAARRRGRSRSRTARGPSGSERR